MRLENFELLSDIELQSDGLIWELHNFADFRGLELVPGENLVVMRWTVPPGSNPWGCTANKFSGVMLHFRNLQWLSLGARDKDMPLSEDTCVAEIFKVEPATKAVDPHLRTRRDWKPGDAFRLIFQFQSGRVIEIESETVGLVPIS